MARTNLAMTDAAETEVGATASAGTVAGIARLARAVLANVAQAYVGGAAAVELMLVGLLADGHLLLEDVPGIGKTTLVKAFARSIDGWYSRIQFTPDLEPADITGAYHFNQKTQQFVFRNGPLMANLLLADEINRAAPRTQSALLEAMEERQYTVEGETRVLPRPFLVCATQNPIERAGTYPLPEAQLDRFLLQVRLGYPTRADEERLLTRFQQRDPLYNLATVTTADAIAAAQAAVRAVQVNSAARGAVLDLVRATRTHPDVTLGASPRASLALLRAAQAYAAIQGRRAVRPADVQRMAAAVLGHRVHTRPGGPSPLEVIGALVKHVEAAPQGRADHPT